LLLLWPSLTQPKEGNPAFERLKSRSQKLNY
jgi:hypothetical protein